MAFEDPIYILRSTKTGASVIRFIDLLHGILGTDSIDRILWIDARETDLRVYIVAFWRVPLVNQFHDYYAGAGDTLHGITLPGLLERLDPYGIFKDGNFPAPHFLRNSKNLSDAVLDELGIGGPGEFIYTQLPTIKGTPHYWQMFRDGTHYMPDMSFCDKPRLEPLAAVNRPDGLPGMPIFSKSFADVHHRINEFQRWRDFYIEHKETWPEDLTEDERARLEDQYDRTVQSSSRWGPECGRDPTGLAEHHERLDREKEAYALLPRRAHATRSDTIYEEHEDGFGVKDDFLGPAREPGDFPNAPRQRTEPHLCLENHEEIAKPPALSRQASVPDEPNPIKRPITTWSPYPAQNRTFYVDGKYINPKYTWNYRKFD